MPAGPGRAWSSAATMKLVCLLLLLPGACRQFAHAQTTVDGAIRGTVADPGNALLSGSRRFVFRPKEFLKT